MSTYKTMRLKRYISLAFSVFLATMMYAQDTITVHTFTFDSVSRDAVFEFPDDPNASYRKIIMEYGMRCHDLAVGNGNVGCREWDYSCNTIIYDSSRVDSVLKDVNGQLVYEAIGPTRYEIMSFVTPYGNGLDLGPQGKMWQFDVTDFGPILKGKKRIALVAGGQNQEEMAITFKFIKGTPMRDVLDIQQVWPLQFGVNPDPIKEDRLFEPRQVAFPANTAHVKLRSIVTGHGQTGEFTAFQHKLTANGTTEFPYTVWLDCSEVPVYPQGGTWIFDRAGWCPGDPSQINEFYLPQDIVSTGSAEIDYSIKDALNDGQTRYIVNNQVVFYGDYNFDNDAEVFEILQPTNKVETDRYNPICMQPQAVIKNTGRNALTRLDLEYGIAGGQRQQIAWNGNLSFNEKDTIDLEYPSSEFMRLSGQQQFEVRITSGDDYADNDALLSAFEPVDMFKGERVLVLLTTNLAPKDNELVITDADDNVVLEYKDLDGGRSYFDEVTLPAGCYRLLLTDSSDDGLYYWFYERNGTNIGRGGLEIFVDDESVKEFEPEFGGFVRYDFVVESETSTGDETIGRLRVFPNPAENQINVEIEGLERSVNLILYDLNGRTIKSWDIEGMNVIRKLELSDVLSGAYLLELRSEGRVSQTRIVVK